MPSANCRKKLGASGIKIGGANCRICAEKVIFLNQSFKIGPGSLPFLIMGALLEKKKEKKK
jgi:hypothetical protein